MGGIGPFGVSPLYRLEPVRKDRFWKTAQNSFPFSLIFASSGHINALGFFVFSSRGRLFSTFRGINRRFHEPSAKFTTSERKTQKFPSRKPCGFRTVSKGSVEILWTSLGLTQRVLRLARRLQPFPRESVGIAEHALEAIGVELFGALEVLAVVVGVEEDSGEEGGFCLFREGQEFEGEVGFVGLADGFDGE